MNLDLYLELLAEYFIFKKYEEYFALFKQGFGKAIKIEVNLF
jgi:hypothetical protein